jgi:hypothetical protein
MSHENGMHVIAFVLGEHVVRVRELEQQRARRYVKRIELVLRLTVGLRVGGLHALREKLLEWVHPAPYASFAFNLISAPL